MAQRELFEEERRRSVQQRTPQSFATRDDFDERALEQRLENRADIHAAYLGDLGAADWLPVRDNRQRFERGARQPVRAHGHLRAFDRFGVLGTGEDLPTTTLLDELYAVAVHVVVLAEFVECRLHGSLRRIVIEPRELFGRNRPRARKERGFKQLRQRVHGGSPRQKMVWIGRA